MAIFGQNTYLGRDGGGEKTKKVDSGADGGQVVRDGGQGWRRERRRRGVAGLVVVMVRNKSKTNCAPRLVVLFIVQSKLFCTAWGFAPAARVPRVPGEGRPEGSQAGSHAGRYPPLRGIWLGR